MSTWLNAGYDITLFFQYDPIVRKDYLKIRASLLSQRYGALTEQRLVPTAQVSGQIEHT